MIRTSIMRALMVSFALFPTVLKAYEERLRHTGILEKRTPAIKTPVVSFLRSLKAAKF